MLREVPEKCHGLSMKYATLWCERRAMNPSDEAGGGRLLPRHATAAVIQSLREVPVVLVNGPRQAGKTTLVRDQLRRHIGGSFVTLDDQDQLQACLSHPV